MSLVERTSRIIHGDLNEGNVFVTDDGYRVIDWQRPAVGPSAIDTVALFEHRPAGLRAIDRDVVGCFAIMRMHWAANARAHYLPHLEGVYDLWINRAMTMIPTAPLVD